MLWAGSVETSRTRPPVRARCSATAEAVAGSIRHYAATGWPRDRERGAPWPDTPARRLLHEIHVLDPDPPQGYRRIYDILAGG